MQGLLSGPGAVLRVVGAGATTELLLGVAIAVVLDVAGAISGVHGLYSVAACSALGVARITSSADMAVGTASEMILIAVAVAAAPEVPGVGERLKLLLKRRHRA